MDRDEMDDNLPRAHYKEIPKDQTGLSGVIRQHAIPVAATIIAAGGGLVATVQSANAATNNAVPPVTGATKTARNGLQIVEVVETEETVTVQDEERQNLAQNILFGSIDDSTPEASS